MFCNDTIRRIKITLFKVDRPVFERNYIILLHTELNNRFY